MKLASAIKGGLTGATTLSLLQEALHKMDGKTPRPFLHKSGIVKKLKKHAGKPGKQNKLYIALAGELLATVASFGMTGLGKRKNAVLTGGLLGAAAGLGVAFFNEEAPDATPADRPTTDSAAELKQKMLTVALYTAGGLVAGTAIKRLDKKTLKKIRRTINA